jgi:peptidyl-prolyl cis-trans isomerase D
MTMLDRMRRHRKWLNWSLALVVLAFIIFYIPDFLRDPMAGVASAEAVAVVEGREIRAEEFRRTYQAQMQAYRQAYGGKMNDQLLKQLGVDQQILQQMVDERAAMAEADRLGVRVSDQEVAQRIYAIPAFQDKGAFIGGERYRQLLSMQNPPLSVEEFEDSVRRSLTVDKLRSSLTEWLSLPDKDVEEEYRRRNEKVKLAVVPFLTESFRPDVSATDEEVAAYFNSHQEEFRIPEKRKIRYLLVDIEAMRSKVVVSPADLERAYNENFDQYTTPDEIRASHILLKTEGKEEAAVKAQAEEIVTQARGGADFAELARKRSEDEATAPQGGDLDFFGRGRMVPEFDEVAFKLEPGAISDPVRTQYGFHVIKLTEKKPGTTRSLDEVRQQLTEQLSFERVQRQAEDMSAALQKQITRPADLDAAAKAQGLTVVESDFFARTEPIPGLGPAPEVAARAFEMDQDDVTGAIRTGRGYVFGALVARQDSYLAKLDEVKDRVRDVVVRNKARDFGREKAAALAPKVKGAADFVAAAKAGGFQAQTTELITRESPIPQLGTAPEVIEAAFALPAGGVSDPIDTASGTAIVKVLEKQEVSPTELTANKDELRGNMLADRKNRFFSAYMGKAKQKMKISVNPEAVRRVVG